MSQQKVNILVDNPKSWIHAPAKKFVKDLKKRGYGAKFCSEIGEIYEGGITIFLSCEKIYSKTHLEKSKHNLVVHESALPSGRGWSPVTWQVLEGKEKIPVCLFEAEESADSGDIYETGIIHLKGHELIDEIREKQAKITFELILRFLEKYPNVTRISQEGKKSYYRRRTPGDSELDPSKSIKEQFNLLRVVDNERYPAFFKYRGSRYFLKVKRGGD